MFILASLDHTYIRWNKQRGPKRSVGRFVMPAMAAAVLTGDPRNGATAVRKASSVMRRHSNSRVSQILISGERLSNPWSSSKPQLKVQEVNRVRERLYIQLKLFVVMGLPWMFEPISWAVDSSPSVTAALPFSTCWVWLVTDLVNMLQVS